MIPRRWSGPLALVTAIAGVCAPGCSRPQRDAAPATMRIGVGAPPTTQATADSGVRQLVSLMTADSLLANTADQHPAERIVTTWSWDAAGTTLRLKLRPQVFFHDGTPVTADLVAGSLRKSSKTGQSTALGGGDVASIDADGSDVVVVRLTKPNSFLLGELAGIPMVKADHPDIGTGPYQVTEREQGHVKLTAFRNYYRGTPKLAGIEIQSYPTQRNAWAALMRDQVDMLYEVSKESAGFVQAEKSVRTYSFSRPYYLPMGFNVRRPVFRDPRVRQAINMAVDRETIVRDGMSGRGSVADGPLWPQNWAYVPPTRPFTYNPAAAQSLLDAAGFPARPNARSGVAVRFSFDCIVFGNDPRFERIELLLQKQLADVGIEMRLVPVSLDELVKRLGSGNFDAFVFEIAGRTMGWVYEFWRSTPRMRIDSGYTAADAILDRIKAARSDEDVRAAVALLNDVLHDDPPAAFLAWQEQMRAVSVKFDAGSDDRRDVLPNIWQWRPATPK